MEKGGRHRRDERNRPGHRETPARRRRTRAGDRSNPSSLESARATLGQGAVVVESDAVSGIDALVERVGAEFGDVDLLVLNAGGTDTAMVADTGEAMYDRLFELNAKAPFFTLQKFFPCCPRAAPWCSRRR